MSGYDDVRDVGQAVTLQEKKNDAFYFVFVVADDERYWTNHHIA